MTMIPDVNQADRRRRNALGARARILLEGYLLGHGKKKEDLARTHVSVLAAAATEAMGRLVTEGNIRGALEEMGISPMRNDVIDPYPRLTADQRGALEKWLLNYIVAHPVGRLNRRDLALKASEALGFNVVRGHVKMMFKRGVIREAAGVSPGRVVNRLTRKGRSALISYVLAASKTLDLRRLSACELAERATAALGFLVSVSNVESIARDHGLVLLGRERPAAVPETPAAVPATGVVGAAPHADDPVTLKQMDTIAGIIDRRIDSLKSEDKRLQDLIVKHHSEVAAELRAELRAETSKAQYYVDQAIIACEQRCADAIGREAAKLAAKISEGDAEAAKRCGDLHAQLTKLSVIVGKTARGLVELYTELVGIKRLPQSVQELLAIAGDTVPVVTGPTFKDDRTGMTDVHTRHVPPQPAVSRVQLPNMSRPAGNNGNGK